MSVKDKITHNHKEHLDDIINDIIHEVQECLSVFLNKNLGAKKTTIHTSDIQKLDKNGLFAVGSFLSAAARILIPHEEYIKDTNPKLYQNYELIVTIAEEAGLEKDRRMQQ